MINLINQFTITTFTRKLSRDLPALTSKPILSYNNAAEQKKLIFLDNVNKSFVYRWTNKINGKTYLGSTANAKSRLSTYFDFYTLNSINMPIYKAILKYGHSNFIFDIVEYCEPKDTIQREQYYLDHFDFDYNVLKKASSSLGYKHTNETIEKMKGRQNLLGYKHTEETIEKLKKFQTKKKHSIENLEKMRDRWAERKLELDSSLSTQLNELKGEENKNFSLDKKRKKNKGKIVLVTNIDNNVSSEYISLSEAALSLNTTRTTLRKYIKNKTVFKILKRDPSGNGVISEQFLITVKEE